LAATFIVYSGESHFAGSPKGLSNYLAPRALAGHYYISAAMSLAIACGLHKIESLDLDSQATPSLIDHAVDLIELGDRINMFWTLFSLDRIGSLLTGAVPCGPTDEKITTLWPCPSEYYEDGSALLQRYGTVRSLYDHQSRSNWDVSDNPLSLRTKGYALLAKASALLAQSKKHHGRLDSKLAIEARLASDSISNFVDSLSVFHFAQFESNDVDGVKCALIAASATAHAAMIQINDILAEDDSDALGRQHSACKNVVLAAREMAKLGDQYFPLIFGVALVPVHQFLTREMGGQDHEYDAALVNTDIDVLLCSLERLKRLVPLEAAVPLKYMWHNPIFA